MEGSDDLDQHLPGESSEVPWTTRGKTLTLDRKASPPSKDWQALVEILLIVVGLLALLLLLPHGLFGDGEVRFQQLSLLLERGQLSSWRYSLIGPLFATPFWLLGTRLASSAAWVARFNLFLFALGLLAFYYVLKDQLDRGLLRRFFLLLIAASMFPVPLGTFYGEPFTALFVAVGIVAATCGPALLGWIAVVLGVANTPASLLGLGLVVLKQMLNHKRLRYLLVLLAAVGLVFAEDGIRRGNPLLTGYEGDTDPRSILPYSGLPGFSYPLFFGLLSILFSFGKGLIFYTPGLLLPVRRRLASLQPGKQQMYAAYMLWIGFLVGLVLVYAKWHAWFGGWFWGPRFFLFASIPASFALAVCLQRPSAALWANLGILLVLALSVWVDINGAVFDLEPLRQICGVTPGCYYIPEFSPLWHPFVAPTPLVGRAPLLYIGYCVLVFIYLALPLLRMIFIQTREAAGRWSRAFLRLRAWGW